MATISNLPTYIQYYRVIEFIRAQEEPSMADEQRRHPIESVEPASSRTRKFDASSSQNPLATTEGRSNHSINRLIGGDVWYNRQNLSRLAM